MVLLVACDGGGQTVEDGPEVTPPDYATIRETYNKKILPLKQMRSNMNMQLTYTDEQGKKRFEDGNGLLIYRYPRDLAMTLGKAGQTGFWFGSNTQAYWVLDLRKPKFAQFGLHQKNKLSTVPGIPIPIDGQIFRMLLHLEKLPANAPVKLQLKDGLISMLWEKSPAWGGHDLYVNLRANNYQLANLTLTKNDEIIIMVNFYKTMLPVKERTVMPNLWPDIPQRFDILIPAAQAKAKIRFSNPHNDPEKITDEQFDLDVLLDLYEVKNYKQLK